MMLLRPQRTIVSYRRYGTRLQNERGDLNRSGWCAGLVMGGPTTALNDWESTNSTYVGQSSSSDSWVPEPTTRPPSTTTTWSAWRTVEIRCATMITVESAEISRGDARTRASVWTSTAENAWSNR